MSISKITISGPNSATRGSTRVKVIRPQGRQWTPPFHTSEPKLFLEDQNPLPPVRQNRLANGLIKPFHKKVTENKRVETTPAIKRGEENVRARKLIVNQQVNEMCIRNPQSRARDKWWWRHRGVQICDPERRKKETYLVKRRDVRRASKYQRMTACSKVTCTLPQNLDRGFNSLQCGSPSPSLSHLSRTWGEYVIQDIPKTDDNLSIPKNTERKT